ncbi:FAST kinase domain-containing protein 4 [Ahaetulla prasina]|uniref:FAST kinase domain-containing protein 4 n=1 Tax=Ahaetulla prasina TaxID=499056 RepID=UPI00264A04EF|nr:FAST kinase domain-containing protein 4 [Ahaetulla prasina]
MLGFEVFKFMLVQVARLVEGARDVIEGRRGASFRAAADVRATGGGQSSLCDGGPGKIPSKMAARLMHRWYWLCRTFSPLGLQAGQLTKAMRSSRPPYVSMTTYNLSQVADISVKEAESKPLEKPTRWEDLIMASSSVEELLSPEHLQDLGGNQAALMITRLSHLASQLKLDHEEILKDKRFQALLHRTYKEASRIHQMGLINLLKSLYFLGVNPQQKELHSAEQELRWRLRELSYRRLASLATYLATYIPKEKPHELLTELFAQLEMRWAEIEDANTIAMLMAKRGYLSPQLRERLEDKSLELAAHFSPEDIRRIAVILAQQNLRSLPLLRAISYHFVQKHFAVEPDILLDLAYAFGKLNFHQTQMFQKICSDLLPHFSKLPPTDVVRCVKSFSYLKWLNLPFFEASAEYFIHNSKKFTLSQLVNLLVSYARLNFQPSNKEDFYTKSHHILDGQLGSLNPPLLVDLVWSLCVLQQAEAVHFQTVLLPKFFSSFFGNWTPARQNSWLKLMHINTTAQLESPGYDGPFLPPDKLTLQDLGVDRTPTSLQTEVNTILAKVAGSEAKVRFDVHTPFGWKLDAEMLLDSENNPLPVAECDALSVDWPSKESLASGVKRLAFLLWEFPNFSSRSKDLLGRFVLERRHLQTAGFVIVEVPYHEWFNLNTEWKKTQYLKDKMQKALAKDLAD